MARLLWDQVGAKTFETGIKQGVLYVRDGAGAYPAGVPWNGLIGVTESPSGAEATPLYANDGKYVNLVSAEEFGATIEAYTYPPEFAVCDGTQEIGTGVLVGQQTRSVFGLAYKTTLGNDVSGNDYGYKLHIIYGALAKPSEKGYQSINDSPEAITFSWEVSTDPVAVTGKKPTASMVIDSITADAAKLAALEDILFGGTSTAARLPLPQEVIDLFAGSAPAAITCSSVPADAATGVAVGANIVLTFNNKIADETIVLTTAAGVNVPFTKSWDTAGKVLTIDPVAATMAAATMHLLVISGVGDIYGQSLDVSVRKFTTA